MIYIYIYLYFFGGVRWVWDFNFSWCLLMRKYRRIEREGLMKLVKKGNCNFDNSVIRFLKFLGEGKRKNF